MPYSAGSYALSLSFSENAESFGANSGKYKLVRGARGRIDCGRKSKARRAPRCADTRPVPALANHHQPPTPFLIRAPLQALIVGDVTVSPSIEWELGTVGIEFHKSVETGEVESLYAPKAELKVGLVLPGPSADISHPSSSSPWSPLPLILPAFCHAAHVPRARGPPAVHRLARLCCGHCRPRAHPARPGT